MLGAHIPRLGLLTHDAASPPIHTRNNHKDRSMHRPVLEKIGVAYSSATTSLAARSGWTGQQPLSQVCNTGLFTWPVVAWTSGAAPHPRGHMHSTHAMPTCSHLACQGRSILRGGGCHLCQRRARLRCLGRRNSVQLQLPVTVPARHATALCHPAWHGPAMASTPLLPTQVAMWGTGGMRAHPPGSCGDPQLSALWSLQ